MIRMREEKDQKNDEEEDACLLFVSLSTSLDI